MNTYTYNEIISPLDQFEIRDLISINIPVIGNLHISLTNIGLYLTLGVLFVLIFSVITTNYNRIISNN